MLTFVLIEWREVRAVGDKVFKKPALSIVVLAAMHYSTEMAAEIAQFEARISQKLKQPRVYDLRRPRNQTQRPPDHNPSPD